MTEELKVIISANIDGLTSACQEAGNSVETLQTKSTTTGDKVKGAFKTVGTAIGTATAAVGTAVVATGKTLFDMAKSTAEYGDEIDKTSQKVGMSSTAYQKWDYAMQIAGTSMSSCTTGLKTLTNSVDDAINGSATAQEKFERLGLSVDDLKDKSREDIFAEVVTALQNVESETDKAAIANDLFGKSGQDLIPLFNMTEEELAGVMAETEEYGMIMSEDAVKSSAAFKDSLTKLDGAVSGCKNALSAQFLPALTDITDGLAGMVAGVDGGKEKFSQGITDMVKAIADALPQFLEAAVAIIEGIIEGITESLPSLFETVTQLLLDIIEIIVENMPDIISAVIEGITLLLQALAEALPDIITAIVNALIEVVNTIVQQAPAFLEAFLQLLVSFVQAILQAIPIIIAALPELITNILNTILQAIPLLIDAGVQLLTALIENLPIIIDSICQAIPQIITGIVTTLLNNIPSIIQAGVNLLTTLINNLPTIITTIVTAIPQIISALVSAFAENIPLIMDAGVQLLTALVQALPQIIVAIVQAVPQILTALIQAIGQGVSQMAQAGYQLVTGLFNGIQNAVGWLYSKLSGWVTSVFSYVKSLFGIHSPSKVMAGFGDYLVQGLGVGIEEHTEYATDAMTDLSEEVENAFHPELEIPEVEQNGVDINGVQKVKQLLDLDANADWIDRLVDRLTEKDTPINLVVDDKILAQTTIESINRLTKTTGRLGLII